MGPLCEFEDNGHVVLECNLECRNHGICRKGAKDVSVLEKFAVGDGHNRRRHLMQAFNEDFEHCVCPRGYVGLQCEYQLDMCPGGAHACLNGGECVTIADGSDVTYACNCATAQTDLTRFAGESCEMEATQFCTIDGGKSKSGRGVSNFCTNGGQCLEFVPYDEPYVAYAFLSIDNSSNCQTDIPVAGAQEVFRARIASTRFSLTTRIG